MNSQTPFVLVIQAERNSRSVDYARLVLDEAMLKHLRELFALREEKKFSSITIILPDVQWIKNGIAISDEDTFCEVFECGFGLKSYGSGQINAQGDYELSEELSCVWVLGNSSDLDTESLSLCANDQGHILIDAHGSSFIALVNNGALLEFAVRLKPYVDNNKPVELPSFSWPNPFHRWSKKGIEEDSACELLPSSYKTTKRTFNADKVLTHLFRLALKADFDPNQRCALYTLAAALIICPQEVTLRHINDSLKAPEALLSPEERSKRYSYALELTDNHVHAFEASDKRDLFCGTCMTTLLQHTLTVRLCYKNIVSLLDIHHNDEATFHAENLPYPSLALLYEDHLRNRFTHQTFVDSSSKLTDDFSRLKLLARGFDALRRI